MSARYLLAPEALTDLSDIWTYLEQAAGEETADRILTKIRKKFAYLARNPGGGHRKSDLTIYDVRFLAVDSYLIIYSSSPKPLKIVSVLHGNRDVRRLLQERL